MTNSATDTGEINGHSDVYQRLAAATPAEKVDIVLESIEKHPEGRLELPARDGTRADLSDVDLSPGTLKIRLAASNTRSAPWWNADHEGAHLVEADLLGANLQNADLSWANLTGATLWDANLREANLDNANLQCALLARADLQCARLPDTNLQCANLWRATLRGASLGKTMLQRAIMQEVDLQGATLLRVNLQRAELKEAKLQGVSLLSCDLAHIYVADAWLDRTRLRREQLGGEIGEERDARRDARAPTRTPLMRVDGFARAKECYRALKQNFDDIGQYDDASWAYCKERRMEKLEALYAARRMHVTHGWWKGRKAILANYTQFATDQLIEWICDYGENVRRVLLSLFIVYCLFTLGYGVTGSVVESDSGTTLSTAMRLWTGPRDVARIALFSLGATTTMEVSGLQAAHDSVEFVARLQALVMIALTGLLGFVLGNRIRHS